MIVAVLWISPGLGCKKKAPDPVKTLDTWFKAAAVCDKPRMRKVFTPKLLAVMDRIFRRGSAFFGFGLKIDVILAMCKAYKHTKWHVVSKKINGDTATISAVVNKQNIRFRLRLKSGTWQIYSMSSPVYQIDEGGLHSAVK